MARYYAKPLVLTPDIMDKYMEAFLPGLSPDQRKDPSISPFYKDLTGLKLPSALFTCGTEDCLLDDTVMMAIKWQMAGAEAVVKLYPGQAHGFLLFSEEQLSSVRECRQDTKEYLLEKLEH